MKSRMSEGTEASEQNTPVGDAPVIFLILALALSFLDWWAGSKAGNATRNVIGGFCFNLSL